MIDSSIRFQAVPADPSPYLISVNALEAAAAELPLGWRRAYTAMCASIAPDGDTQPPGADACGAAD